MAYNPVNYRLIWPTGYEGTGKNVNTKGNFLGGAASFRLLYTPIYHQQLKRNILVTRTISSGLKCNIIH